MTLTKPQHRFFDTFGFLHFPGLLADRIDQITEDFEQVWAEHGGGNGGRPHDGQYRSCIVPFIDQNERLCTLLNDERIAGTISSLLGEDFNYFSSDGNYYAGNTGWQSDGWRTTGYLHIKIALYLDQVTAHTGALRVIRESHRVQDSFAQALQEQIKKSEQAWDKRGAELPGVALESRPGDLVLLNQNLKHVAFGGGVRRRMFTMNFTERYRDEDLDILRGMIGGESRFWIERMPGKMMVETADIRRMCHLEQVRANDHHLAELSRQKRAQMLEPARG